MGSPAQVTREELMVGELVLAPEKDTAPPAPHYQELPPVEVVGYRTTGKMDILAGAISVVDDTAVIGLAKSPIQRFVSRHPPSSWSVAKKNSPFIPTRPRAER